MQHVFAGKLRGSVGGRRLLQIRFLDGHFIGKRVSRRGAGKHDISHIAFNHRIEQLFSAKDIFIPVQTRHGYRFRHGSHRGKMHHRFDIQVSQSVYEQVVICQIANDKPTIRDRIPIAIAQVIESECFVTFP